MKGDSIQEEMSPAEHLFKPELEEQPDEVTLARAKELSRKIQDWTSTGPNYREPSQLFGSETTINTKTTISESAYAKPLPCPSCLEPYDLEKKLPRVLVQCGHTLCTSCLEPTYRNKTVRCPICFKVLNDIAWASKLPLNSQVYTCLYAQKCVQLAKEAEQIKHKQQYQTSSVGSHPAHQLSSQQSVGFGKSTGVVVCESEQNKSIEIGGPTSQGYQTTQIAQKIKTVQQPAQQAVPEQPTSYVSLSVDSRITSA
jgi:RING-type zinc-finger